MKFPLTPISCRKDAVREPPASLLKALRHIGPGRILTGSIVGTGELIATTHVGAQAGFALLWLVILSCFIKIFAQIELGRYAISSGQTTLAALAFYLLGAAVLHQYTGTEGLPGTVGGMLSMLSRMYIPVLGEKVALWFIVIGAFAVLFSTFFASTASACRALPDFLRVNGFIRLAHPDDRRRWVRRFAVGLPLLNLCLFVWVPNPVKLVIVGGFAQAVTLPMVAAAAVYLRYRRTDRRLTPGLLWDIFLWVSMLGFFAAALYGVWNSYQKLL